MDSTTRSTGVCLLPTRSIGVTSPQPSRSILIISEINFLSIPPEIFLQNICNDLKRTDYRNLRGTSKNFHQIIDNADWIYICRYAEIIFSKGLTAKESFEQATISNNGTLPSGKTLKPVGKSTLKRIVDELIELGYDSQEKQVDCMFRITHLLRNHIGNDLNFEKKMTYLDAINTCRGHKNPSVTCVGNALKYLCSTVTNSNMPFTARINAIKEIALFQYNLSCQIELGDPAVKVLKNLSKSWPRTKTELITVLEYQDNSTTKAEVLKFILNYNGKPEDA